MEHIVTIEASDVNEKYPFVLTCTCNWQGVGRSDLGAKRVKDRHLEAQAKLEASKGIQAGHL